MKKLVLIVSSFCDSCKFFKVNPEPYRNPMCEFFGCETMSYLTCKNYKKKRGGKK